MVPFRSEIVLMALEMSLTDSATVQDTGTIRGEHGTSGTGFCLNVPFLRLIELSELSSHPTRTL